MVLNKILEAALSNAWDWVCREVGIIDIVCVAALGAFVVFVVRKGRRRVKSVQGLPDVVDGVTLRGYCVRAVDGDTFWFYHCPFLRRLPKRRIEKKETLSIRLAGVDAPELGHYGNKGQPLAKESQDYLASLLSGRKLCIVMHKIDLYGRPVATVTFRRWFLLGERNVSVEMVKAGYACVFPGKYADYGEMEAELRREEARAKRRRIGIWGLSNYVSPMEYKREMLTAHARQSRAADEKGAEPCPFQRYWRSGCTQRKKTLLSPVQPCPTLFGQVGPCPAQALQ